MNEELKDWRGTPITAGCTIVYPGRASSSMWMNEGTVKEINVKLVSRWNGDPERVTTLTVVRTRTTGYGAIKSQPYTIDSVDRVTVVPGV